MLQILGLIVLNLPMLGEVIRKYLIQNDFVFLAADVLALVFCTIVLLQRRISFDRLPIMFYLTLAIFIFYTAILHVVTSNNIGIYGIGIRMLIMPIVYLLISGALIRRNPGVLTSMYWIVTFWVLVAGAMAVAQIALGRDHPINTVWGQSRLGMGDYVGQNGLVNVDLFRPTSIFTHTAKFGQAMFVFALFRWSYLALSGKRFTLVSFALIAADLITVLASGQRGAFLFLLLGVLGLALYRAKRPTRVLITLIPIAAVGGFMLLALLFVLPQYGDAVQDRFLSAFTSIPARLEGNLVLPMISIFQDFLFSGRGLGFYTFGSRMFGGSIVYFDPTLHLEGVGESSFVRFCVEVGLVATLVLFGAFMALCARGRDVANRFRGTPIAASAVFYLLWVLGLLLWCNTADAFANTVAIFYGYGLSGGILVRAADFRSRQTAAKAQPATAAPIAGTGARHPKDASLPGLVTSLDQA